MKKNLLSHFFFLGILYLTISFPYAKAQGSGYIIECRGKTIFEKIPLPGVQVTVFKNGELFQQSKSDKNGKFQFDLPFHTDYKITFEKTGYLNMFLLFDAHVPKGKDNIFYTYQTEVPCFKTDVESFDKKKYNYPFTKVFYDPAEKQIKDDVQYMTDFANGIVKEMQEFEKKALAEKEALEKVEKEKKATAKKERLKNAKEEFKKYIKVSATLAVFDKRWKPLSNKKIELVNSKGEVVETTKTNQLGGFAFKLLKTDEAYLVRLAEPDASLPAFAKIMISNKNGKEIGTTSLDEKGKMKFDLLPADRTTNALVKLDDENNTAVLNGKIFSGDGSNKPLQDAKVNLLNNKGLFLKSVSTNNMGEFEFNSLATDQNYLISLDVSGIPESASIKSILLKDKNGNDVKTLQMDNAGKFQFKFLVADIKTLSYMKVEDTDLKTELTGMLFAKGVDGKALVNIGVQLLNDKEQILQTTKTDETGKFVFADLVSDYYYQINVDATSSSVKSVSGIILKDANNNPIKEFEKEGNVFKYEFLSYEETKLAYTYVDDPWLKVLNSKDKNKSGEALNPSAPKESEYYLKERVTFKTNDASLQPEAKKILDKVIGVMEAMPGITVELSSHTDSKGSDAANMTLSEQRAKAAVDYIISNGIPANRIVGKGYGETKVLNRCSNGIACSDEEHAQNRRIEFKVMVK